MNRTAILGLIAAILAQGAASAAHAHLTPLGAAEMARTRGGLAVERFDVPAAPQTRSKFDNVQAQGSVREALTPNAIELRIFAGEGKVGAQLVTSSAIPNDNARRANFALRTGNATDFPFAGPSNLTVRFLVPAEDRANAGCPANPAELCIRTAGNSELFPRSVSLEPNVALNRVQIHFLRDAATGETTFLDPRTFGVMLDNASFTYDPLTTPSVDALLGQDACDVNNTVQLRLDNGAVSGYDPLVPLEVPAGCTRIATCMGGQFLPTYAVFNDLANRNGGERFLHIFVFHELSSPNVSGSAPFMTVRNVVQPNNFFYMRGDIDRPQNIPFNPLFTARTVAHEYGHNRSLSHADEQLPFKSPIPPGANDCALTNIPSRNVMCSIPSATFVPKTRFVPGQCQQLRVGSASSIPDLN